MKVIVASDVWSEAFRKVSGEPSPQRQMLSELVEGGQVQMLGCIRQEVLQGIRNPPVFERIRQRLRSLPDLAMTFAEYELAAEFFNACRSNGIQGSSTDFLICACSAAHNLPILTKDRDFERYAEHLPLRLVGSRPAE